MGETEEVRPLSHMITLVDIVIQYIDLNLGNKSGHPNDARFDIYESKYVPEISLKNYIRRIRRYMHPPESVFVCCIVFMDRMFKQCPYFRLTVYNVHRTLLGM
jgi:hypothetical protein